MNVVLYNTLTRRKEPFVPRDAGRVGIYVCGVTPYDASHLGHARPSVVFDVLRRFLRKIGYDVKLVQNFTDVDDKILRRAAELGMDPIALSRRYSAEYLRSMEALGVEPADVYPKVSEHIDDIIRMVEGLVDRGIAYVVDGDVYYDVTRFAEYGKLSNQRLEDLMAGARIEVDERKRHPMDFALWKAAKPGELAWESPWGPGRPGWHIECSAMSLKYLGTGFDIHGGGADLIFPHHENEIAQSEAYAGAPFVRYWLHNGLLNLGTEKMSKSLGNSVTVAGALEQYSKELLRYYMLSHHYRSTIEFSDTNLTAAQKGWNRLNDAYHELKQKLAASQAESAADQKADPQDGPQRLIEASEQARARFMAALADDVNTAVAIAALFELVRDVNQAMRVAAGGSHWYAAWKAAHDVLDECAGEILGILTEESTEKVQGAEAELLRQVMDLLLAVRQEARQKKDWATADSIRIRLQQLGIAVEDTASGPIWRIETPRNGV